MQRRTFLFRSGMLAPAVLLSPSVLWSQDKHLKTDVLFITADGNQSPHKISSMIDEDDMPGVKKIDSSSIKDLIYSSDGFVVKTKEGLSFMAGKLVFAVPFTVDPYKMIVNMYSEHQVGFNSGKSRKISRPEFWVFHPEKLNKDQLISFLKRKRHAFMCVS